MCPLCVRNSRPEYSECQGRRSALSRPRSTLSVQCRHIRDRLSKNLFQHLSNYLYYVQFLCIDVRSIFISEHSDIFILSRRPVCILVAVVYLLFDSHDGRFRILSLRSRFPRFVFLILGCAYEMDSERCFVIYLYLDVLKCSI